MPPGLKIAAFIVAQSRNPLGRHCACQQAAPEAADAEACWFFRREHDQLDGANRLEAAALQGSNGFKRPQHSNHPVVLARIRDGINVRTRRDRLVICFPAPQGEQVADSVFMHR